MASEVVRDARAAWLFGHIYSQHVQRKCTEHEESILAHIADGVLVE